MSDPTPSKDLARVGSYGRSSLTERQQYAIALAAAGELVPRNFWTKPENINGQMVRPKPNPGAVLYMLETAAMIGVHPMVGLTNIHIIEGKPSLSANLQAALVREAGHRLRVWVEGKTAICEIVRSDDKDFTFRVEWGDEEMNAAGLANKDNWKKYQRSMKKARAITECIREACPEVLMGATYSPDELGANTDEMGEPIDLPQVPTANVGVTPQSTDGDVSRETPIVDDTPQDDGSFDWGGELAKAGTKTEVGDLYQRARREGLLTMPIQWGGAKRELGEVIIEVGQAFAAAEEADAVEATVDEHDEGEPAVLDPDVVDADVVEDGQ